MKKLKLAIVSLFVLGGIVMVPLQPALAACSGTACIQQGVNDIGGQDAGNAKTLPARIKGIVNVFLFITGTLAVIMIIIGGIRYVISAGDNSAVTGAKNTILYAVIGLVVAILAYAIINFVISSFK